MEPSGESDEDLWSEVSLRGNASEFLEDRGHADSGAGSGADIVDLMEEAAIIAPEVLFEDEAVFEEVVHRSQDSSRDHRRAAGGARGDTVTAASEPAALIGAGSADRHRSG